MVNTNTSGLTAGGNQLATNNEHMLDVNNPRSVIFSNTSHKDVPTKPSLTESYV